MKYCMNCKRYKRYYLKRRTDFCCAGVGYCWKKDATVYNEETCEAWEEQRPVDKTKKKQEVYRAIVQAGELLFQLKQIVKEDFKQ